VSLRFRVIGSGGTGNTTLVEADGTRILLDAGLGPRELAERLQSVSVDPASMSAVFVSHEHGDHAGGAAVFARKWGMRLCGTRRTYAAAGLGAEEIPGYDVLEPGVPRQVGCLSVLGVPVPHDAAGPVGFVVS
jgi:phosphoribosyl 1,2-cyclic phosphodiesterase